MNTEQAEDYMPENANELLNLWLGIPLEEHAPTHYRILGLAELEPDVAVIEFVSGWRMEFVSGKLNEPTREFARKLLSQMKTARRVLLRPDEKAKYDAQLRREHPSWKVPSPCTSDDAARRWLGVITPRYQAPADHLLVGVPPGELNSAVLQTQYDQRLAMLNRLEQHTTDDEQKLVAELISLVAKAERRLTKGIESSSATLNAPISRAIEPLPTTLDDPTDDIDAMNPAFESLAFEKNRRSRGQNAGSIRTRLISVAFLFMLTVAVIAALIWKIVDETRDGNVSMPAPAEAQGAARNENVNVAGTTEENDLIPTSEARITFPNEDLAAVATTTIAKAPSITAPTETAGEIHDEQVVDSKQEEMVNGIAFINSPAQPNVNSAISPPSPSSSKPNKDSLISNALRRELDRGIANHAKDREGAKKKLSEWYGKQIEFVRKTPKAKAEDKLKLATSLEADRVNCERIGYISFAPAIRAATVNYLLELRQADDRLVKIYEKEIDAATRKKNDDLAKELRKERDETLEPIPVWRFTDQDGDQWLFSNGSTRGGSWTLDSVALVIRYPKARAPGGFWIDTLKFNAEGTQADASNNGNPQKRWVRSRGVMSTSVPNAEVVDRVAPGFTTDVVGEADYGGLSLIEFAGRPRVIRTHPVSVDVPCTLHRRIDVPAEGETKLLIDVAPDPRGDWRLVVRANRRVLHDSIVDAKSLMGGWRQVETDLTPFAGKSVLVELENRANGWKFEYGYWGRAIVSSTPR